MSRKMFVKEWSSLVALALFTTLIQNGYCTGKDSITGSYTLTRSENFNEYMIAVGVGWVTRVLANAAYPTTIIKILDPATDEWKIKTATTFKSTDITFRLGVQFDETTADGRSCKSTITRDGQRLVHFQNCGPGQEELKILREFSDEGMQMILYGPGNVVSTRFYKRD